jgi:predicted Zn finger-like uncharacterized protein
MRKSDVTCPECGAGYRRIELISRPGDRGEFRCLVCDHLIEVFDGARIVALRLTVQPERRTVTLAAYAVPEDASARIDGFAVGAGMRAIKPSRGHS